MEKVKKKILILLGFGLAAALTLIVLAAVLVAQAAILDTGLCTVLDIILAAGFAIIGLANVLAIGLCAVFIKRFSQEEPGQQPETGL